MQPIVESALKLSIFVLVGLNIYCRSLTAVKAGPEILVLVGVNFGPQVRLLLRPQIAEYHACGQQSRVPWSSLARLWAHVLRVSTF